MTNYHAKKRQEFCRMVEEIAVKRVPSMAGKMDWDTVHHFFNCGVGAMQAAGSIVDCWRKDHAAETKGQQITDIWNILVELGTPLKNVELDSDEKIERELLCKAQSVINDLSNLYGNLELGIDITRSQYTNVRQF